MWRLSTRARHCVNAHLTAASAEASHSLALPRTRRLTPGISGAAHNTQGTLRNSLRGLRWMRLLGGSSAVTSTLLLFCASSLFNGRSYSTFRSSLFARSIASGSNSSALLFSLINTPHADSSAAAAIPIAAACGNCEGLS